MPGRKTPVTGHDSPATGRTAKGLGFLIGGGKVAKVIREKNWSDLPLGLPTTWPDTLKTAVSLMLPSPHQSVIFWGEEFSAIYNDAYIPVMGNSHPRALGQPANKFLREIWGSLKPSLDKVYKTGKPVSAAETKYRVERYGRPEFIYENIYFSPIRHNGRIAGVLCIVSEVTEQKNAVDEMRARENRFRALFERSSDAVEMIDAQGNLIFASDSVVNITGYKPAEVVGANVKERIHPDDWPAFLSKMKRLIRSPGATQSLEYRVRHKNGGWIWLETIGTNHLNTPGVNALVGNFRDITERKRDEEARSRLAAIVESSDDAIIGKDLNGVIQTWNKGAQKLFGYTAEEVVGRPVMIIIPPDRQREEDRILRQIRAGKGVEHFETVRRRKDGSLVDVSLTISPIRDSSGRVVGASKTARDITGRKQSDAALRAYERRWLSLIENSNEGIALLSLSGKLLFASAAISNILGYTPRELMAARKLDSLTHPDDVDWVRRKFASVINPGVRVSATYRVRAKDGSYRWVAVVAKNDINNPNVKGVIINFRDVTDARRARESLVASERRYRFVAQNASDVITIFDRNGTITYQSSSIIRLLGLNDIRVGGDIINSPLVHPDDRKVQKKFIQSLINSKPDTELKSEFRMLHADGSWRHLEVVGVNLLHIPEVGGVMLSARDVTDRKITEQQRDEFIAIASHELKTPVTSMKMYAALLERKFRRSGNEAAVAAVSAIESQLERMNALVRDLLDASRIETRQLRLSKSEFDYDELVSETITAIQPTSNRHFIRKIGSANVNLVTDRERIGQVLTNLLENAIKYSPDGGVIRVSIRHDKNSLITCVSDNGIGIPKERQARLFQRFSRVGDKRTEGFPGLGLGLYITAQIVERVGGKIWVKSEDGRGSKFYFSLPLAKLGQKAYNQHH